MKLVTIVEVMKLGSRMHLEEDSEGTGIATTVARMEWHWLETSAKLSPGKKETKKRKAHNPDRRRVFSTPTFTRIY